MKTLVAVISLLAVIHVLAAAGFVGWMVATERVNQQRLEKLQAIFEKTIPEAEAEAEKQAKVDAEAREQAERLAALEGKSAGPESISQRLEADQQRNEITLRQIERTRQEVESLQRNLRLAQQRVEDQYEQLQAEKKELEKRLADIEKQRNDEGFKKAVELYQTLPSKQTKAMFVNLMREGNVDQVVAYLEAMEPRKAAAVLEEFKTPDEVAKATELTERLRARGSDLVQATEDVG